MGLSIWSYSSECQNALFVFYSCDEFDHNEFDHNERVRICRIYAGEKF
jgi:hypothetical protein